MVVLQTFFQIISNVDGVWVQPFEQGTTLFNLIALDSPLLKFGHAD